MRRLFMDLNTSVLVRRVQKSLNAQLLAVDLQSLLNDWLASGISGGFHLN